MNNRASWILAFSCSVLFAACNGAGVAGLPDGAVGDGASCLGATSPCSSTSQCCGALSCGTTTLGQVCCGNEGESCTTENGEDCCGDLLCVGGHCTTDTACLAATSPCSSTSECCGDLACGTTTLGQVCCGNTGASCATANGEDCCGDLLCIDGVCGGGGSCNAATEPCSSGADCCSGLSCGTTTLGQVCCGNTGASCATANGEDCCGDLLCIGGVCGGSTGGGPTLVYYPVRAAHNNGYDSTAGNSSLWSCDDANSNSDFVPGDHLGNDIWAAEGAPVVATVSGTLRLVRDDAYSGNKVTVVDDSGWSHFYAHLQGFGPGIAPYSSDGARVNAGQVVGYVGRTGTASNGVVHLHYSIYPDNNYSAGIDPWPALHAVEHAVCSLP